MEQSQATKKPRSRASDSRAQRIQELNARVHELEERLAESEETLRAIRSGEIDAVVVSAADGDRVYTLRGADESYRVFVEQMREGAVTLSCDGDVLYANQQFAALVGTPLEQVIGSHFHDFLPEGEADPFKALLDGRSNASPKAELQLRRRDGSLVPIYLSAGVLDSEDVRCHCVLVVDLTEQKHNEEIQAAERLARSILQAATEPMVVLDQNGRIIRANEAAHKIAGRNVLLQPFDTAFTLTPSDIGWGPAGSTSPRVRRFTRPAEATIVKGGESSDVLISAGTLQGAAGESLGWVVTLADITRQKRIERELRASNDDLQRFAYAISHDLQEPLRTIASFTQLLARKTGEHPDPDSNEFTKYVLDGVSRMQKLIDGLLTYSRVSHGPLEQRVRTDCHALVSYTLGHLQAAIQESGAQITFERLPVVEANDGRLLQVFQNLISNAIKYRSDRPLQVHITAKPTEDEWIFAIRDNGIGIDMTYADRIFGVFQRLHSNSEIEGTGIGLAIVQRIIERQGGRIWLESEVGKGSTFYFTVPRSEGL